MTSESTSIPAPLIREDHISQIPALQVLQNLGYAYITPDEAIALRAGRTSAVLLESVLAEQLRKINRIRFKGQAYAFSEGNIQSAIQDLKSQLFEGLIRTNEKVYDLLDAGRAVVMRQLESQQSMLRELDES